MSIAASSNFVAADGDGYELQMGRWSRRLCEPFLDFAGTEPGDSILDVGCGTGCLADALIGRSRFGHLRGVDFSPVYVDHAAKHTHDPRVTFEVGDACALTLPDRSFDRVFPIP